MISIKNKTGNDYFTQWDTKQILVISGELSDPVLHCRVDDTRAMVLPITDGECTLDDTLLQKRGVLDVWVYDEHRTKRSAQFRVLPKPKPDDYVATPSAAKTWEDLDERVTALEKGGGGGSSADHEAVVANTAARHTHDNKAVLDGITGVVTADNVLHPEHITDLVQYGAFRAAVPGVQALGLTSATVGQLARIKAVDANGAPTAWETINHTWTLHQSYNLKDLTFPAVISIPQKKDVYVILEGIDITTDRDTKVTISMATAEETGGHASRWSFSREFYAHSWGSGMMMLLLWRDNAASFKMYRTSWQSGYEYKAHEESLEWGDKGRWYLRITVNDATKLNADTTATIKIYTRDYL